VREFEWEWQMEDQLCENGSCTKNADKKSTTKKAEKANVVPIVQWV